jgi:hypothetical protein
MSYFARISALGQPRFLLCATAGGSPGCFFYLREQASISQVQGSGPCVILRASSSQAPAEVAPGRSTLWKWVEKGKPVRLAFSFVRCIRVAGKQLFINARPAARTSRVSAQNHVQRARSRPWFSRRSKVDGVGVHRWHTELLPIAEKPCSICTG